MPTLPVVKAYWWDDPTKVSSNFGDALAPYLLKHFSGIKTEWSPIAKAKVVSIGSVLEHIPPSYNGFILGSGRLLSTGLSVVWGHTKDKINLSNAKIISLRGPLSARGLPGCSKILFGDPGLLADELVGEQEKLYDLGIVPHWSDRELVPRFLGMNIKGDIKVIRPDGNPLTVVKQIGQCRRVVTSSLHGIIVADAFGNIPRRLEISSTMSDPKEGGDFKFRDYHASIGMAYEPGKMGKPDRWAVEDVKYAVFDAFKILEKELRRQ